MILTLVGTGTLVPHARRGAPALAVEAAGVQVTVDGGSGTLRRQAELGIDFRRTDALLFTHIHLDHTLDLLAFLFASAYTPGFERERAARVVGPPGFRAFVEALAATAPRWLRGGPRGFVVEEILPGTAIDLGGLTVEAEELPHAVTDVGYRFRDGDRVAAVTGDATWDDRVVSFARDADLLVADASGTDTDPRENHMTAREAGRVAARAGVRQLVLTHLYPVPDDRVRVAEAAAEYDGPILLAEDGDRFLV